MLGRYLKNRRRNKEIQARKEQIESQRAEAYEWLQSKMRVEDFADDTYDKEVLPRLSPVNFAFENRELNQATDPWVSATKKWFSEKNA